MKVKRLIRYSAAGLAQMGIVCCPNCFGQAMPQLLCPARIGLSKSARKLAVSKRCALRLTTGAWTAITRTQATRGA